MEPVNLISYGGAVKDLGEGKVGGYLVMFGDAKTTDLVGDFFTKSTNFGKATAMPLLYHHGFDSTLMPNSPRAAV